jgi:hypothetical protein
MQKFMKFFTILLIIFFDQQLLAKEKRTIDYRIYTASLWIDNLKMPITSGRAVWIDSMFVLFKANKQLSLNDVHSNVILQINDAKGTGTRAFVVDYDLSSGWMLAEVKKKVVSVTRQKLGDQQIINLLVQNDLIDQRDKKLFLSVLARFDQNRHTRGIAGDKDFYEILGLQIKEYAQKMTNTMVKSQRKIFWRNNISMPLPLVDSCSVDPDLLIRTKNHALLKLEQAYTCHVQGSLPSREVSSTLKPEYTVLTGVLNTDEPFLKIPSVVAQLSLLGTQMDADTVSGMALGRCISHWIAEKQLYIKSCITRNGTFNDLYDGYHMIGFYHNQKIIYKFLKTKSFTKDNQMEIVEKMLNSTRGSVL